MCMIRYRPTFTADVHHKSIQNRVTVSQSVSVSHNQQFQSTTAVLFDVHELLGQY